MSERFTCDLCRCDVERGEYRYTSPLNSLNEDFRIEGVDEICDSCWKELHDYLDKVRIEHSKHLRISAKSWLRERTVGITPIPKPRRIFPWWVPGFGRSKP